MSLTANILAVGGGGGGSGQSTYSQIGGGGGGGKVTYSTGVSITPVSSYTVTVGAGGLGETPSVVQTSGGSSSFSSLVTSAGGGASGGTNPANGGTSGSGKAGGNGNSTTQGGGGGGDSVVGSNYSGSNGGNGGAGTANSISGSSVYYGGGGGGGSYGGTGGTGGLGGGGNSGSVGTANTGGGGGATGDGQNGGTGIVIVSIPTSSLSLVPTVTGTGNTVTTSGSNTLFTFIISGTLQFPTRYWVGGTGSWDASTTTHWSTTSGGSGGASVPTSSNNIVFDANSGSGTAILTTAPTANTIDISVSSVILDLLIYTVTLTGTGTVWNGGGTLTAGTFTITVSDTSSSSKTFAGGGLTYYNLTFTGGTGVHIITGSNTFNALTITTPPSTINFTAGTTQTVSSFPVTGSAGNLNTLQSTASGSPWYLASANQISIDYVSLQDSHAVYI